MLSKEEESANYGSLLGPRTRLYLNNTKQNVFAFGQ